MVFGKNAATAGAFPANLDSHLSGTNGFKLTGVAAGEPRVSR